LRVKIPYIGEVFKIKKSKGRKIRRGEGTFDEQKLPYIF